MSEQNNPQWAGARHMNFDEEQEGIEQDELWTEEEAIAKCKLSHKTVKLLRDMSDEAYKEVAREIIFLAKPIILAKAK